MKPLAGEEIIGNWGTLLLPVNSDESIDMGRLSEELDVLTSSGLNGIYSFGTAGEFYNTTEQEFDEVSLLLAEKCHASGTAFQTGASHMSPITSLNRVRRCRELKPSAIQVILPDWFRVTDEEALSFLEKMAEEAGDIGLVLYNPPQSKRNLAPLDFKFLKNRIPSLVGIKVAGGNEQWYTEIREHCPNLSVFIPGHLLATGYKRGAHGAYSNVACLNPGAAQEWFISIMAEEQAALELEHRINVFFSTYIHPLIAEKGFSNQAVDKCLAGIGNWSPVGTRLRWPYKWIPEDYAAYLRPKAKEMLPEFFK